MKTLLIALGLKDTSSEAEALAALTARSARSEELEREVLALAEKSTIPEARGVLAAWKSSTAQVAQLTDKVAQLEGERTTREVTELMEKGKAEGKITSALEPVLLNMGKRDPTELRAYLAAATRVIPVESREPTGKTSVVVLTDTEKMAAKLAGVSEEAFAATKARVNGQA